MRSKVSLLVCEGGHCDRVRALVVGTWCGMSVGVRVALVFRSGVAPGAVFRHV